MLRLSAFALLATLALPLTVKSFAVPSAAAIRARGMSALFSTPTATEKPKPPGIGDLRKWDPSAQAWIDPALHNKNPVRLAAIIAATAAAARSSVLVPGTLVTFVHMLAFAIWFGTTTWTTFFAGITMFRNLPRQTFGKLQSKLFPLYFLLNSACIAVAMATLSPALQKQALPALAVGLVANAANLFVLEPKSTDIMLKRYDLENKGDGAKETPEYKALAKSFGKLHGLSSLANLGALIAAFAYAWKLAAAISL